MKIYSALSYRQHREWNKYVKNMLNGAEALMEYKYIYTPSWFILNNAISDSNFPDIKSEAEVPSDFYITCQAPDGTPITIYYINKLYLHQGITITNDNSYVWPGNEDELRIHVSGGQINANSWKLLTQNIQVKNSLLYQLFSGELLPSPSEPSSNPEASSPSPEESYSLDGDNDKFQWRENDTTDPNYEVTKETQYQLKFITDQNNELWMATSTNFLYSIAPGITIFSLKKKDNNNQIYNINDYLWYPISPPVSPRVLNYCENGKNMVKFIYDSQTKRDNLNVPLVVGGGGVRWWNNEETMKWSSNSRTWSIWADCASSRKQYIHSQNNAIWSAQDILYSETFYKTNEIEETDETEYEYLFCDDLISTQEVFQNRSLISRYAITRDNPPSGAETQVLVW